MFHDPVYKSPPLDPILSQLRAEYRHLVKQHPDARDAIEKGHNVLTFLALYTEDNW